MNIKSFPKVAKHLRKSATCRLQHVYNNNSILITKIHNYLAILKYSTQSTRLPFIKANNNQTACDTPI